MPHIFADSAQPFEGYTPAQMRAHYGFPADLDGSGQTIGLVEASSGFAQSDIDLFCVDNNLPPCIPEVVSIDGGTNDGGTAGVDAECTLDVEGAHGMAPGAKIRVYEVPSGGTYETFWDGLLAVLRYIAQEANPPGTISISYGDGEPDWTPLELVEADGVIAQIVARGTAVFISSGDQGAYGTHVYPAPLIRRVGAPASCPHAVSVGGTRVPPNGAPERSWNNSGEGATGGGFSVVFKRPAYQDAAHQNPMRGVPDFSMLADPVTGWRIVFQGQPMVIGGTSASSPAAASAFACVNQARARVGLGPVGDILPTIYAHPEAFEPVRIGDNSFLGVDGYQCAAPWSACCGLGAPKVAALVQLFTTGGEVKKVPAEIKEPIFVAAKQIGEGQIIGGFAYGELKPVVEALGATITHDEKGIHITPKA